MTADKILDGAVDGQDWSTAALCILANPCASQFSRPFVRKLSNIVFNVPIEDKDPELRDPERIVTAALKIIEAMEAQKDA